MIVMESCTKISVICVYNNTKQLESELLKSLRIQDVEYELVLVDNGNKQYSSAAKALNHGAGQANGEYLIFTHQDITLKEKNALKDFIDAIKCAGHGSLIGAAGAIEGEADNKSNFTDGVIVDYSIVCNCSGNLQEVSCIDEAFFGMTKETWQRHHFDEELCDNWHLYAVEACLYARKHGFSVFLKPVQIHHSSLGHISQDYMRTLKRLCKAYRRDFKRIWTTCYKVRTNPIYIDTLIMAWKLNRIIRRKSLD